MIEFIILIALGNAVICAALAGQVAKTKGYESSGWQVAGLLCGPLALIAIAGMPDKKLQGYIKAIAQQQGVKLETQSPVTAKAQDQIEAKTNQKTIDKFINSPLEDYKAAVALYKSNGGSKEPDYAKSCVFATTITLKNLSGKTLGTFSREGGSSWRVIYITS